MYERVRPNLKPAAQPVWEKKDAPEGIARDEANQRETEKRKKEMEKKNKKEKKENDKAKTRKVRSPFN